MHKYIFDTGIWINLFEHYPKETFTGLWKNFNDLLSNGNIVSSSEVLREISKRNDIIFTEATKIKHIFQRPTIDEMKIAKDIVNKYQFLVKKRSINIGNPEADAFIIAMGKALDGTVVTTEKLKQNAQKIPNICKDLDIKCLHFHEFFKKENWEFK